TPWNRRGRSSMAAKAARRASSAPVKTPTSIPSSRRSGPKRGSRLTASRTAAVAMAMNRSGRSSPDSALSRRTPRRKRRTARSVSSTAFLGSVPGGPPPSRVWIRSWRSTRKPTPGLTRANTKRTAFDPKSRRAISSAMLGEPRRLRVPMSQALPGSSCQWIASGGGLLVASVAPELPQHARGQEPDEPTAAGCRVVHCDEARPALLERPAAGHRPDEVGEQLGDTRLVSDERNHAIFVARDDGRDHGRHLSAGEQRLRRRRHLSPGASGDLRRFERPGQRTGEEELRGRDDPRQPSRGLAEAPSSPLGERAFLVGDARGTRRHREGGGHENQLHGHLPASRARFAAARSFSLAALTVGYARSSD